jgi:hypothetical protein
MSNGAFVYRTKEFGGTYCAQDAYIVEEGRSHVYREEDATDIDLGGEIGRAEKEAARASFASLIVTHPLAQALNSQDAAGRAIVLSVDGSPLRWTGNAFDYPIRHGRVHATVSHAGRAIADWDIETGQEGGTIAPYWTGDGRMLALMERRWMLRFSGLVRLSDGEAIAVGVRRIP